MATKYYWIGSTGPFKYDDTSVVNDSGLLYDGATAPDQAPVITTGQLNIKEAPTLGTHVLRSDDVGGGGLVGDVSGPSSSTDNAVARFDGTDGKSIQSSAVTIDDDGSIDIPSGEALLVNSVQVVAAQGAAVANATDAATAISQLNALLARLRTHGLIAT